MLLIDYTRTSPLGRDGGEKEERRKWKRGRREEEMRRKNSQFLFSQKTKSGIHIFNDRRHFSPKSRLHPSKEFSISKSKIQSEGEIRNRKDHLKKTSLV